MSQPQQQNIFQNNGTTNVTNNFTDPPGESETAPVTVKLKDATRQELKNFCFDHDITLSGYVRDAVQFYRKHYFHQEKLAKYETAVAALLRTLP